MRYVPSHVTIPTGSPTDMARRSREFVRLHAYERCHWCIRSSIHKSRRSSFDAPYLWIVSLVFARAFAAIGLSLFKTVWRRVALGFLWPLKRGMMYRIIQTWGSLERLMTGDDERNMCMYFFQICIFKLLEPFTVELIHEVLYRMYIFNFLLNCFHLWWVWLKDRLDFRYNLCRFIHSNNQFHLVKRFAELQYFNYIIIWITYVFNGWCR